MADRYQLDPEEALDAILGATVDRVEDIDGSLVLHLTGDLTLYADAPTVYGNGPATDNLDLEHLTALWASSLQATCPYDRGVFQGRFFEYVAQNAVDQDVASQARVEASKQVYGNGPSTGAQC